jgi:hypothetical protein
VADDQDPATGRVAERAGHRGGQSGGHLAVVVVAGESAAVPSGAPVGENLVVNGPRLLVAAAIEIAVSSRSPSTMAASPPVRTAMISAVWTVRRSGEA